MMLAEADRPPVWGYIEGYYGKLFGWKDRNSLVDGLADACRRFDPPCTGAYVYAPKEDSLHRRDWRIRYPSDWRKRFRELVSRGAKQGVEVVPGMAPGLSFDYLAADDYRMLLSKFRDFQKLGCRTLVLLMDDIPPVLPRNCAKAFSTLGAAHGSLLRKLYADLRATRSDCTLWFCPTVYTDQFASGPVEKDPYLLDLAAKMPRDVDILWTGPRIVSERLDARALGGISRIFRGRVLLWDNYYANDYCPNKLFLGPYLGRTRDIWRLTRGVLINPTGLPGTDRFLLDLLAAFRRGRPPLQAWKEVAATHGLPREFTVASPFLSSPFFAPRPADLKPARLAALHKALKMLIWDWKGLLHQEWYPYLFMLEADLKASARGKDRPDEAWVRKRYPPLIARLLLKAG